MTEEKINLIVNQVTHALNLQKKEIFASNKRRPFVDARHLIYFCCYHFGVRNTYIREYFWKRDYRVPHVSIIHGVNRMRIQRRTDQELRELQDKIIDKCTQQMNYGSKH
jgi:hypothetical protein